jgi:hypothetical protein
MASEYMITGIKCTEPQQARLRTPAHSAVLVVVPDVSRLHKLNKCSFADTGRVECRNTPGDYFSTYRRALETLRSASCCMIATERVESPKHSALE